jgi:hypothetical protein
MSSLDEMWKRLGEHQSRADERGYGYAWRKMCAERTPDAASDAAWAAYAADAAWAEAAEAAAKAAWDAAWAAGAVELAIKSINKAEEK